MSHLEEQATKRTTTHKNKTTLLSLCITLANERRSNAYTMVHIIQHVEVNGRFGINPFPLFNMRCLSNT